MAVPQRSSRPLGAVRRRLRAARGWMYHAAFHTAALMQHGRLRRVVRFHGGLGDELMCTAVLHEWRRRGGTGLAVMTATPDLFLGNPDADAILPMDYRFDDVIRRVKGRLFDLQYARSVPELDMDLLPGCHVITRMCGSAGVRGRVAKRPYLHLSPAERAGGKMAPRQVAVQSSGMTARHPMQTKEWFPDRFQAVVGALRGNFTFVQIGSANDPPLAGVIDLRGRTSVRRTAAVLAGSVAFLGLEGFLMHLARAVGTRGAIVIGGRIPPWQFGYGCNENLTAEPACSPCWLRDRCPHDRECMRRIEPERVVEAVRRVALLAGEPIADEFEDTAAAAAQSPSAAAVAAASAASARSIPCTS